MCLQSDPRTFWRVSPARDAILTAPGRFFPHGHAPVHAGIEMNASAPAAGRQTEPRLTPALLWALWPLWCPAGLMGPDPQELVSKLLPQEPTWPQCPGQERAWLGLQR